MPVVSSSELSQRRQEILDGARRCFAEHGYEGATVRRLEETIGKSRGAIFHHFGDKENLFLALAREDAARMAEVVAANGLVEVMRDMLKHPERHWLPGWRLRRCCGRIRRFGCGGRSIRRCWMMRCGRG